MRPLTGPVPLPAPPARFELPAVTVVVTVRCTPRAGQEFGDVHTATSRACTRAAAVHAATETAARLAAVHSPGRPFHVSSTRRY